MCVDEKRDMADGGKRIKGIIEMDFDFKSLVERIQTGERDYVARLSMKGTDYRETPSLFVKSIDEANRQIEAVVSDGSVDRDEEILLPSAFKELLGEYLKNPVIISAHQNRLETGHSSVIGQAIKVWIEKDGLHVIIWFAETELGNEFWYLYKNKFQRAFSVGFIPLEWTDDTVNGARVRTFTKCELLEISCVPVPTNRNALSRSKQRKADFIADKIAQRKAEDDDLAEVLIAGDFKSLGLPEIDDENLESEPDYAAIAKGQSVSESYTE